MILLDGYNEHQYYEEINDGCVEMADYLKLSNGNRLYVNGRYCGEIIVSAFAHPESDSYWIVCKHSSGNYFEINIDNAIGYGFIPTTADLSGGSQW